MSEPISRFSGEHVEIHTAPLQISYRGLKPAAHVHINGQGGWEAWAKGKLEIGNGRFKVVEDGYTLLQGPVDAIAEIRVNGKTAWRNPQYNTFQTP